MTRKNLFPAMAVFIGLLLAAMILKLVLRLSGIGGGNP